jgi:hypothetical protein
MDVVLNVLCGAAQVWAAVVGVEVVGVEVVGVEVVGVEAMVLQGVFPALEVGVEVEMT